MSTPLERASDPATDQAQLAQLAADYPTTRTAIAHNPSAYPGLLDWLRELGDPGVDAALASRDAVLLARARLDDSTTPAEELAELALRHPELRALIAVHPAAYDALREWIAAQQPAAEEPLEMLEVPALWTPRRLAMVAAGALLIAGGTVAAVAAIGSLFGSL